MNARVAGERWALRRVMKANVSYSGGSKRGACRAGGVAARSSIERGATVSPRPRAARSSAAVRYSTSICGSIVTPACWARSRSWRRVGSSRGPAGVVEDQRRLGEPLDRHRLAHAARGRRRRRAAPRSHAGAHVEPAVLDRQDDQAGLELAVAHGVGDLGGVLADRAHADLRVARCGSPGRARRAGSGGRCRTCRRRPCRRSGRAPRAPTRRPPAASASVRSACGRSSRPASVSSSPRPARTNSGTPSSASSRRICSDRLGWAISSDSAAAENEPCSAAARK